MIIYVENPMESKKRTTTRTNKLAGLQDIILMYKSELHFYMLVTIRIQIKIQSIKNMKKLGIYLSKYVKKNLYIEN